MRSLLVRHAAWIAVALALAVLGSVAIARAELARLRDAFETDARISAQGVRSERNGGHLDEQCAVAALDQVKELLK